MLVTTGYLDNPCKLGQLPPGSCLHSIHFSVFGQDNYLLFVGYDLLYLPCRLDFARQVCFLIFAEPPDWFFVVTPGPQLFYIFNMLLRLTATISISTECLNFKQNTDKNYQRIIEKSYLFSACDFLRKGCCRMSSMSTLYFGSFCKMLVMKDLASSDILTYSGNFIYYLH